VGRTKKPEPQNVLFSLVLEWTLIYRHWISVISSIFRALIRCVKYVKRTANELWFYEYNFIA